MMSRSIRVFVLFVGFAVFSVVCYCGLNWTVRANYTPSKNEQTTQNSGNFPSQELNPSTANRDFGNLPLYFAVNRGQVEDEVKYYSAGNGYNLLLTEKGATLRLVSENAKKIETDDSGQSEKAENFRADQVHLNFIGADFSHSAAGEDEQSGKVNYFVGSDASQWQTNISTFAKVRYKSVYPGIDVLFYGNQRELEYDFIVAPRADPSQIEFAFDGAKKLDINERGELVVKLQNGEIVQRKPVAYQFINGLRQEVTARFFKKGDDRIVFRLGKYDSEKELIIDPIIIFSTYFGGSSSEIASSVKTDGEGNIYLTGATASPNFPTVNAQQPTPGGTFSFDAFVTKINAAGNSVVYSTYLGGNSEDAATSLNVDDSGNVVITGRTYSPNFPTVNAVQTQIGGNADGFVAKLNSSGSSLTFSTFLGGVAFDDITGSALDLNGSIALAGRTESGNFPTVNPLQSSRSGNSAFRSADTGGSWMSKTISPNVTTVSAFAVVPDSSNTVFAATNIGVFRSSDGGTVWTEAGRTDLATPVAKIAVARFNPNVIYAASNGTIYKSSNGGDNWTIVPGNFFPQFNTVAVDPNNADTVFAGGFGGAIYKSTDAGMNWSSVSINGVSATVNSIVVDPSNPQIVYVGTGQRIYKSTVGGGNWTAMTNGLPFSMNFWDLLISAPNNIIYAAAQNGLFKSSDAGATWTQINAVNLVNVRSLAQDPNNSANLFAANGNGVFFRSLDGGTSWTQSNNGLGGNILYTVAATSNSVLLGGYSGTDVFVSSLGANGNVLNYSTFLGGSLNDGATGIRVDALGRITFVGVTNSTNFPTFNAVQSVLGGGNDAFAARLTGNGGALLYSTFLGGASNDAATALAIDNEGHAYVAGNTISTDFPVQNALQPGCASCAAFSNDVFVTKLSADGRERVYSTYLGGSSAESGTSVEVDLQNRAVVVGATSSNNFPVLDAIQSSISGSADGFISYIKADGSGFVYSTYFGGNGNDAVNSVTIAPEGNAIIAGQTTSFNLPTVRPIQSVSGGGQDAFIAKIGVAADLEIIKIDQRDPVMVNNPLIYTLQVKNNGPSVATGIIITDNLPAGANFVSSSPSQGSCVINGLILTCSIGDLAANAQTIVRVVLTPVQTGTFSSEATVKANEPDPIPGNNRDVEQTVISALPSIFGRVTTGNGQPASDVGIAVEGFENRTLQTDASGVYSAASLPLAGNYTVRPVKAGYYFSPRSKSFNNLLRDETADFVINTCSYTLSVNAVNTSAAGGNQSIFVTANDPFCSWTATSNAPWISINSGGAGYGNGTVKISIQPSGEQRSGTLTIAGQTFTVTQTGCSFSLMPFQQAFGQNGGTGTIAVTASQSFCQWTATANDSWIAVTNNSNGTGNGTISYTVTPTSRPRNGRIMVAGQAFPIWQEFNSCPAPSFGEQLQATINAESVDIVTADFNNDTIPDLATVDLTSTQTSTFSTYIGNGNGTFNRNTRASTIGPLTNIIAADFNRDSKIDFAVAGSGKIAVYSGEGNGGFTLLTSFEARTGYYFSRMLVEDFNRDGKPDLLVGTGDGIYLYNGNGDGTFAAGASYPVGGRFTYAYGFGDLNGDGATDIVVGSEEDFNIPRLIYFFGSASGTFTQGGVVPFDRITPATVKVADLNGDGSADVVTNGFGASQVQVLLWNRVTNSFRSPVKVFTEPFAAQLFEVADMNNDSIPDIISTSREDFPRRVNVMRGNGNGTFRLPVGSKRVSGVNAMAIADYNRDGRLDLAYALEINQMAVQLNLCSSAAKAAVAATKFDFDGDRKADFSVVRPSENIWHIYGGGNQTAISQQFGTSEDISVPADYDGDGRTDVAVYRPSEGVWYRYDSSDNLFNAVKWGQNGDIPAPADYDGDDRADFAVFRPANKVWYWLSSLNGQMHTTQFGLSDDIPVVADYDGDSKADVAVFRPSNGSWYWLNSSNGDFQSLQFGSSEDKPVVGDYDGDGKADQAVFRPSSGIWYVLKSSDKFSAVQFGISTDLPVPADYDGDGKTDIAVYRDGTWFLLNSTNGFSVLSFGGSTDKPVANSFIP